ncbi:ABC transporter permease [Salinibius halmophilus]|uniref:ABC transporter permease n=1 Tax=Salinibius halmophilus TaxID=1853216 RepID=UPI000E67118B|nr:ABC transporter permease [Salinibius halmophilus]
MNALIKESFLESLRLFRLSEASIPTLLMPLLFYWVSLGLFNLMDYRMLMAIVIIASMTPGAFSGAIYVANERQSGWLNLRWQFGKLNWWLSKQVALAITALVASTLVILLATLTGQVVISWQQVVQLLLLSLLTSVVFASLGIAMGMLLSESGAIAVVNVIFFPLVIVSGITVPLSSLPSWLAQAAPWLPPMQLLQLSNGEPTLGLITTAVGCALLTIGSFRLCRY